jgi:hypothetical protein
MNIVANPAARLLSAIERLSSAMRRLRNRGQCADSVARFGDLETDRALRARLFADVRDESRSVREHIRECAVIAYGYAACLK